MSDSIDLKTIINDDEDPSSSLLTTSHYYDIDELKSCNPLLQDNNFNLLNLNIQSLNSKIDELLIFLNDLQNNNLCKFNILTLQETWLKEHESIAIPGYNVANKVKLNSNIGGGLAIYIDDTYDFKIRNDILVPSTNQHKYDYLFIEVFPNKLKSKSIIVGTVYRSPGFNSNDDMVEFNNSITNIVTSLEQTDKDIIISGDFNLNLLKIDSHVHTANFLDTMISHGFIPQITLPTRINSFSSTLIDNVFIRSKETRVNSGIIATQLSDHYPMFISLQNRNRHQAPRYFYTRKITKENINSFISKLNKENWSNVTNLPNEETNTKCTNFLQTYTDLFQKTFPLKQIKLNKRKHKISPWSTHGIITSINSRDKLYKQIKKEKCEIKKDKLKANYVAHCAILKKVIRKAKSLYWKTKFENTRGDLRNTWKNINTILNNPNSPPPIPDSFNIQNKLYIGHKNIATGFNKYFSSIGLNLTESLPKCNNNPMEYLKYINTPRNSLFLSPTYHNEVLNIVKSMKNKTSYGPDNISPQMLKSTIWCILDPLLNIFNASLATGIVPDAFKIGKVIPVFKKGNTDDISNYRPISILSSFSKILERLVFNRLYTFLTKHNLLHASQYGFRKHFSTEDAMLELQNRILKDLQNNHHTAGIFMDMSKAFDTIDHDILLQKLSYYGIRGTSLNWFYNYLTGRKQYVTIQNKSSTCTSVVTGVPQGSILGPLLFIIYINDISFSSKTGNILLFADDASILYRDKNKSALEKNIETDIKNIISWLNCNKLSLNVNKTHLLYFKPNNNLSIHINNTLISNSNSTTFLGLEINKNLNWKDHIRKIGNKIAFIIYTLNKLKNILPKHILRLIYTSLILPHLNYGLNVWFNSPISVKTRLIKLQKRAIRIISGVSYNAHTDPLYADLNILKLEDMYNIKNYSLYLKLLKNECTPFIQSTLHHHNSHTYNTRLPNHIYPNKVSHNLDKQQINYQLYKTLQNIPTFIKNSKANTNTIKHILKSHYINQYKSKCKVKGCYICNK